MMMMMVILICAAKAPLSLYAVYMQCTRVFSIEKIIQIKPGRIEPPAPCNAGSFDETKPVSYPIYGVPAVQLNGVADCPCAARLSR